jgi:hypothetical protein
VFFAVDFNAHGTTSGYGAYSTGHKQLVRGIDLVTIVVARGYRIARCNEPEASIHACGLTACLSGCHLSYYCIVIFQWCVPPLKVAEYDRIVAALRQQKYSVDQFVAEQDFPAAASADNSMAIAAAELTIMTRASFVRCSVVVWPWSWCMSFRR